MVRTAGRYLRWTHERLMHSTSGVCAYAAWRQMVPICTERWRTEANKATKLTAIIQLRQLTLFGHIMCMDDNADAKRILLGSLRQAGEDNQVVPASRGSASSNRIWKKTPYAPRSSRFGSEPPSVEDDVDICMVLHNLRAACQKRRRWQHDKWPALKISLPVTADVGNLLSKFEHCMISRFGVNGGHGTDRQRRTDRQAVMRNAASCGKATKVN